MECDKEEAVRAKDIAERKMQLGEYVSARKLLLKAQRLFPNVYNISQLTAVCEVHCAAQNRINGFDNWYGILQVEQSADETAIKKQYRKLALLLHPDKNKFSGAEAAFKLIGQANTLLMDKAKRSLYDVRCRPVSRGFDSKPVPCQSKTNAGTRYGAEQGAAKPRSDVKQPDTAKPCSRANEYESNAAKPCPDVKQPDTAKQRSGANEYEGSAAKPRPEGKQPGTSKPRSVVDETKRNAAKPQPEGKQPGTSKPRSRVDETEHNAAKPQPDVKRPDTAKPRSRVDETERGAAKPRPEPCAAKSQYEETTFKPNARSSKVPGRKRKPDVETTGEKSYRKKFCSGDPHSQRVKQEPREGERRKVDTTNILDIIDYTLHLMLLILKCGLF